LKRSTNGDNTSATIVRNSFWYGFENLLSIVLVFATSIPLARVIGPEGLGYFNYIGWLTGITATIGGLGLPFTARKYIAESLGRGEEGIVRSIYFGCLRLHLLVSVAVTMGAIALIVEVGDPRYRLVSILQAAAMLPGMANAIPSQTNVAKEDMRSNVNGGIASATVFLLGTWLSLLLHWNLVGVAASFLTGRAVETAIRFVPSVRWARALPQAPLPLLLRRRMRAFAFQEVGLMLVGLVVWDRSDVVMLKWLSKDVRQITFFTIAFNLTEKVLLLPKVFGAAVGASQLAQAGRANDRLEPMTMSAAKYMYLAATPMMLGLALLSNPIMRVLYGRKYIEAIPVLTCAALFAVCKSVMDPVDFMIKAKDRQFRQIVWSVICAAINVGIDWLLISNRGAVGAAIGNGVAQTVLVFGYWGIAVWLFGLKIDWISLGKITVAGAAMAPPILLINRVMPALPALVTDMIVGGVVFLVTLRSMRLLDAQDIGRLEYGVGVMPKFLRGPVRKALAWVAPASAVSWNSV
jgi:O-antigen/teichoic acid export membrane protein